MQVSFDGQSRSTRHSGSSVMTAENSKHMQVKEPDFNLLLQLTLYTSSITISYQRMSAGTSLSMVAGNTVSTNGTVAWVAKRLTFLSGVSTARNKVTFLISSTIIITGTSSLDAGNQRISLEARWTNTNGCVEVHLTVCSGATDSGQARIDTFLRFASFVQWTVPVNLTLI